MRTYCQATNQLPTLKSLTASQLDFAIRPDLMAPFVLQAKTLTPEQVAQVTVPAVRRTSTWPCRTSSRRRSSAGGPPADTTAALAEAVQKAVQ